MRLGYFLGSQCRPRVGIEKNGTVTLCTSRRAGDKWTAKPWTVNLQCRKPAKTRSCNDVSGSSDEIYRDDNENKPSEHTSSGREADIQAMGSPNDGYLPLRGSGSGPVGKETADGAPLTLGSEVMGRMAKLRALDQYRRLMVEIAATTASWQKQQSRGELPGAKRRKAAPVPGGGPASTPATVLTAAGDDSLLLLRGALLIARHRYPSLDDGKVYGTLDDMARRVAALLPSDPSERYPLRVVAAINRVIYSDYGFRGNEEDYYNADNSCINRVIERRVGIPITLSLVYSEVARRVGLPMRGLNLPGHFMLQPLRPVRYHHHPTAPVDRNESGSSGSGSSGGGADRSSSSCGEGSEDLQLHSGASESGALYSAAAAKPAEGVEVASASASGYVEGERSKLGVEVAGEVVRGGGGARETVGGTGVGGQSGNAKELEEEDEDTDAPLEVLVDAFRSGEVCLPRDAEDRISAVLGSPVRIDPRVLKESQPLHPRMFLFRMLSNLRSIYLSTQQVDLLLDVLKFMRVTLQEEDLSETEEGEAEREGRTFPPSPYSSSSFGDNFPLTAASASLARDEGLCYFALRRYPECLEALREYLLLAEQTGNGPLPPEEAQTVAVVMEEARRRMTHQRQ